MSSTWLLPRHETSPALASCHLDAFDGLVPGGSLRDAQLLVAELVSTAMTRDGGTLVVSAGVRPGRLRVSVRDGQPVARAVRPRRPGTAGAAVSTSAAGPGMTLLSHLAQDWGVREHGDRAMTVWFVLTWLPVLPHESERT